MSHNKEVSEHRVSESGLRIAAADSGYDQRVRELAQSVTERFRYHSIELPDRSVLPGLQSLEHLRWRFGLFGLPEDLRGKRVLDIGAWDGWFSFECERRGAEVVATDCVELDTFLEARELLGSRVEYLALDVGELSSRRVGRFDIVLFLGVLYHLRHPLLGLEKVLELCTDTALIESFVIAPEARPIPAVMEFYERAELGGQIDNWCGPSPECLLALCRSAGFAQADLRDITNNRASVVCRRRWPDPLPNGLPPAHLVSSVSNRSWSARFHPAKEEYICCYFKWDRSALETSQIAIEVDGFGVPCLSVTANGPGAWQANCLRPAGLAPGRHRVHLRILLGERSNPVEFSMLDETGGEVAEPSAELPAEAPELCSAEFQASRDLRIALNRGGALTCYFRSSAESLGPGDVVIGIGGATFVAHTVASPEPGVWQANILLTESLAPASAVRLRLGAGPWSQTQIARA
jgi:tRNA (mo5U34)-methyltransferase